MEIDQLGKRIVKSLGICRKYLIFMLHLIIFSPLSLQPKFFNRFKNFPISLFISFTPNFISNLIYLHSNHRKGLI